MFKEYREYRRKREHWLLAMLSVAQPEAVPADGAVQRYVAREIAALSPIERQQIHGFYLKSRGGYLFLTAAKLICSFSLAGMLLHQLFPDAIGWQKALALANALGLVETLALIHVWFNYRKLAGKEFRAIVWCALWTMLAALLMNGALNLLDGARPPLTAEGLGRNLALAGIVSALVIALPIGVVSLWRNRQFETMTLQLQHEAERERLSRELSESQLRLLRAQIEPHFLFNTLGAVQQLAEAGAPRAAELTANLIAFLRASLADMRSEQASLASEFGLVQAYLQVMQARLGARLSYRLDLPADLAHASVPSMLLLTLAENAIKHGIEPSLRGGAIEVSARLADGLLRLRVRDSGVGLGSGGAAGAGLGLQNVRARLRLFDAGRASLTLHNIDAGDAEAGAHADPDADDDGAAANRAGDGAGNTSGAIAEITLPMKAPPA